LYKSCATQFGLKGAEVVAKIAPLPGGDIIVQETSVTTEEIVADPIAVEQPIQEEWQGATHGVSLGSELMIMLTLSRTLEKMMKQQSVRAMKKMCNL
jgi:hypothetical protein